MPVRHPNGGSPQALAYLNFKFTRVDWAGDMFVLKGTR